MIISWQKKIMNFKLFETALQDIMDSNEKL